MTPEGQVRAYLRKRVLATGGEHRKLQWIGRRGAPDEFVFWPKFAIPGVTSWCAFIEVKRLGEKPTPQQFREHERLYDGGFRVFTVDSKAAVDKVILKLTGLDHGASLEPTGKDV